MTARPILKENPDGGDTGLPSAALVLCAHGSGGGSRAAERLAREIAGREVFARVEPCSIAGTPGLPETLAGIPDGRVYLTPLLMAEGYTYDAILPRKLADARIDADRVIVCRPIGVHPGMARIAAGLAADACADRGWEEAQTSLVVAAHGTKRHPATGESAFRLAETLGAAQRFGRTRAAFLEQEPFLGAALRDVSPNPCVVVGFFLEDGAHGAKDAPEASAAAHPAVAYTGAIGARPEIADIVLDLVQSARI